MSFRYYLYISDSKVDMLLAQIEPGFARKRTSEISLGMSVAGAKRTVEAAGPDRIARLERVVRHLHEHGDVGTVDEPGQFFWGLLPMQWGLVGEPAGSATVYFGGRDGRTLVGLGGAAGHVLGTQQAAPSEFLSPSWLPALLHVLHDPEGDEQGQDDDRAALSTVHRAHSRLRGPAQNVEFVAKRLLHGPSPYPELDGRDDMRVLLGSPLYVALVD